MASTADALNSLLSSGQTTTPTGGIDYSPLLGMAMGLLGSSGATRLPTTMGAALANGLGSAQQYQASALQNALNRNMLGYKSWLMQQLDQKRQSATPDQPQNSPQNPNPVAAQQAALGNAYSSLMSGNNNIPSNTVTGALNASPYGVPYQNVGLLGGQPQMLTQQNYPQQQQNAEQSGGLFANMNPDQRTAALSALYTGNAGRLFSSLYDNDPNVVRAKAEATQAEQQLTPEQVRQYFPGGLPAGYTAQMNALGKVSLAGTDPFHTVSGYNPQTGAYQQTLVDTRNMRPIANVTGAPPDPTKPLSPILENQAAKIASYDQRPPVPSSRNPQASILLARAYALNPDYNAANYDVVKEALTSFTSGKLGIQVASANKAVMHLDTLSQLADNLNNTNSPAYNYVANFWKQQTGQTAPNNFNAAKTIALNEVTKFIIGAGGSAEDRDKAQAVVKASNSPQQLAQAIDTIKQLMGGQLLSLQKQYEASTGLHDFGKRFLFPKTQQLIQGLQANQQNGAQPNVVNWSDLK